MTCVTRQRALFGLVLGLGFSRFLSFGDSLHVLVLEDVFREHGCFGGDGGSLGLLDLFSFRLDLGLLGKPAELDHQAESLVDVLGALEVVGDVGIKFHDGVLGEVGALGEAAGFKRAGTRTGTNAEVFATTLAAAEGLATIAEATALTVELTTLAGHERTTFTAIAAEFTTVAELTAFTKTAAFTAEFAAITEFTTAETALAAFATVAAAALAAITEFTTAETALAAFATVAAAALAAVGTKGSPMRAVVLPRFAIHFAHISSKGPAASLSLRE